MTTYCSGLPGAARSGFATAVAFTVPAIAALLNNADTAWAVPVAGFLGLLNYDLGTFCTNEPPAVPTFTAADIAALIYPLPTPAKSDAIVKFNDLIGALVWGDLCECVGGSTPARPAGPSEPSDMPQIDPPVVVGPFPNAGACQSFSDTRSILAGAADETLNGASLYGSNPTSVRIHFHSSSSTAAMGITATIKTVSLSAVVATLGGITLGPGFGGQDKNADWQLPAGTDHIQIVFHSAGNVGSTYDFETEALVYCNNQGPAPLAACCPPDATTTAILNQILSLVTIMQRQSAPFGYLAGAVHSGLTGQDSFAVTGLIGVAVSLTTVPSPMIGMSDDNPDVLWRAGSITWQAGDGSRHREWIERVEHLSLPTLAGVYTSIAFALAPGVVATITELEREP